MIIEKESDLWCTPPELIDHLGIPVGGFFMDACCNKHNCVVPQQKDELLRKKDNGLDYDYLATDVREWHKYLLNFHEYVPDTIFMNPPYSGPEPFMKKAWNDSKYFRVMCLVKTDMSTDWFNFAPEHEDSKRPFHLTQWANSSKYIEPVWTGIQFLLHCMKHHGTNIGVYHLRKRVKFYYNGKKAKSSGTFPSCIVIYDRRER